MRQPLGLILLQLPFIGLWSWLFFGRHQPALAFVDLGRMEDIAAKSGSPRSRSTVGFFKHLVLIVPTNVKTTTSISRKQTRITDLELVACAKKKNLLGMPRLKTTRQCIQCSSESKCNMDDFGEVLRSGTFLGTRPFGRCHRADESIMACFGSLPICFIYNTIFCHFVSPLLPQRPAFKCASLRFVASILHSSPHF